MTKPDVRRFHYSHPVSDEVIAQMTATRQSTYVPTGEDAQWLAVYMTTPPELKSDEIVVRPAAWSDDNGRPEGGLFDAYLAAATGRRVLAPNAPGVDHRGFGDHAYQQAQRLTLEQRRDLSRGRFGRVGAAVMTATDGAARFWGAEGPYTIVASSMGTALSMGMLREAADRQLPLSGVALAETVNGVARPFTRMAKEFIGQKDPDLYLRQNPPELYAAGESMAFWLRRVWEARQANLAYVRAMAMGRAADDLGAVEALRGVPVYLSRGSESRLSPVVVNDWLEETFRQVTDVAREEFPGADHPYTMTVQSVVDEVHTLATVRG